MSLIRLQPECIRCILDRQLAVCPEDAPKEIKLAYMQKILSMTAQARKDQGVPVLLQSFYQLQYEMFGLSRDYTQIKAHFNALLMKREDELWSCIEASSRPLEAAIQFAMIGNYIDFSAKHRVEEKQLDELLAQAASYTVAQEVYQSLLHDLEHGKRLVYLFDNCGEIVMDKLLIRAIRKAYPALDITAMVRGIPISNDATMEDARQVGLTEIVRVVENGNGIAGTSLDHLSAEAKKAMDEADVILSKGQGNFETLNGCGLNIYYVFMCKCEMFAKRFQVPRFSGVLVNDCHLPEY